MVVVHSRNVVKRGLDIKSAINVSCGSSRFLAKGNLNRSLKLSPINTKVVGTPQMVFIHIS
jgi:hypothetical protein